MDLKFYSCKSSNNLYILLIFIFLYDLSVLLNIYPLRQILGFFLITFLPGVLILFIMNINYRDFSRALLLSVGISLIFLLVLGYLLSTSIQGIGSMRPLSLHVLLFSINAILIILIFLLSKKFSNCSLDVSIRLCSYEKGLLIIPILMLPLSLIGTRLIDIEKNNLLIVILLIITCTYVPSSIFLLKSKLPENSNIYPFIIFLLSLSLVFLTGGRSNHILIGADTGMELFFLKMTSSLEYWKLTGISLLDACLAISILPSIYGTMLNINEEHIFKLLFTFITSLSPLVIYLIANQYFASFQAFLAAFFFMSQRVFLAGHSTARTNVALFFISIAVLLLINKNFNKPKTRVLFILTLLGIIVSHYSSAYIFFFILLISWILHGAYCFALRFHPISKSNHLAGFNHEYCGRSISILGVVLFFTMIFIWYSQLTQLPFSIGIDFIQKAILNMKDLLILDSGGTADLLGADLSQKELAQQIELSITWLTFLLIGMGGFVTTFDLVRGKNRAYLPYILLADSSILLLGLVFILPSVTYGYDVQRIFSVPVVILSVSLIFGGTYFSKKCSVKKIEFALMLILMIYFACTSGMIYQFSGDTRSLLLNSEGSAYNKSYIHDSESFSARWLSEHYVDSFRIYTDSYGLEILVSQSMISPSNIQWHLNENSIRRPDNHYLFLRSQNVLSNELIVHENNMKRAISLQNLTGNLQIYSSGYSKVFF